MKKLFVLLAFTGIIGTAATTSIAVAAPSISFNKTDDKKTADKDKKKKCDKDKACCKSKGEASAKACSGQTTADEKKSCSKSEAKSCCKSKKTEASATPTTPAPEETKKAE